MLENYTTEELEARLFDLENRDEEMLAVYGRGYVGALEIQMIEAIDRKYGADEPDNPFNYQYDIEAELAKR